MHSQQRTKWYFNVSRTHLHRWIAAYRLIEELGYMMAQNDCLKHMKTLNEKEGTLPKLPNRLNKAIVGTMRRWRVSH
ncbi:hypothetical protein E4T99_03555 [Neisseria sp. WF04]|nr:hypothetical protein E4T99_03555 [Neisseria sp. WF04]